MDFLRHFEPEVQGRGADALDASARESLVRFAQGKCSPTERRQMCDALQRNPEWLNLVAKEVKGRRNKL